MAKKNSAIHLILTGGTIDSYYEGTLDTVRPHKHSIIPRYIKSLKLHQKTTFKEVCMKDSRDLNETDFKNMLRAVEKSPSKRIIITHGTYAMPDTARYLEANLKRKDKTIIFTGSLIPLSDFAFTDASFNLGYSVAKIHHLRPGIYVCMNGRIFSPAEIAKLLRAGRFISIFGEKPK